MKKLYQTIGLETRHLTSEEYESDVEWYIRKRTKRSGGLGYGMHGESPLDHTGPMPTEYQKDPFEMEALPLMPEARDSRPKLSIQERTIWLAAAAVSWSVTAIAVLRALRII